MARIHSPAHGPITKYFKGKPPPATAPLEAEHWLRASAVDIQMQRFAHAGGRTLGEHLAEWWELKEPRATPAVVRSTRTMFGLIRPLVGIRLADLRSNRVQRWINDMQAAGKAPNTINKARNTLSQMMDAAVEWDLIARNPVKATTQPTVKPVRPRGAWTTEQARVFLAATSGDPMHSFWCVLLYTGMRHGEVRALRWADVDFDGMTISLTATLDDTTRQRGVTTKTKKTQAVPLIAPLADALRAHRQCQPAWIGKPDADWVFRMPSGEPLRGQYVRIAFARALSSGRFDALTPHELRHTAATLMAESGVPTLVIASILGHATAKMVERTYAHPHDDERRKALEAVARKLSG